MGHNGRIKRKQLFALGLLGCRSRLRGLGFNHALLELVHAASGINKFLLTRVEGMALIADADDGDRLNGAGLDHVTARATNLGFAIVRMNVSFHKRGQKVSANGVLTRGKLKVGRRQPAPKPGSYLMKSCGTVKVNFSF